MSLGYSLLIVAVISVVVWAASAAFGFQMALWPSLALSVVLTLVLNLVLRGGSSRR